MGRPVGIGGEPVEAGGQLSIGQVLRKSLALKRGEKGEREKSRARGVTLSGALPVPDHPRSPCRACCPSDDPRPRLHGRPTDRPLEFRFPERLCLLAATLRLFGPPTIVPWAMPCGHATSALTSVGGRPARPACAPTGPAVSRPTISKQSLDSFHGRGPQHTGMPVRLIPSNASTPGRRSLAAGLNPFTAQPLGDPSDPTRTGELPN